MKYESRPQELWRSSRDLISVPTDEQEQRSGSSGGWKQIRKTGAVQYWPEEEGYGEWLQEMVGLYHCHSHDEFRRCSLAVLQPVEAPVGVVWSLLRRFDEPQIYKQFVRSCFLQGEGDLKVKVSCLREVRTVSGLHAAISIERLDILDEERHILSFSVVGGDHRLSNYRSITTLHERLINGKPGTIVIESYVVDVPHGNTKEETCLFVDTIVKCNLQPLAHVSKHLIAGTHRCLYHCHSHDEFRRCSSGVLQPVEAPVGVVWSLLRRFDEPQIYKQFVRSCFLPGEGDLKVKVGCLREVRIVSGLPAATSTERLDILDEERHILSFSIVGGDHRLSNYRSITTLHERLINGKPGTIVIESYVVDVPHGNTKEETCLFVDTIVKCNLQSLAHVSKNLIAGTHRCL